MSERGTKKAKNPDLWERLLTAYEKHDVTMVWVKGHVGIDDNERCDQLAAAAAQQPNLPPDKGYRPNANIPESRLPNTDHGEPSRPKAKITKVGQPCRMCGTAVEKRTPRKKTVRPDQAYYFAWYLYCPACKAMYMVEDAKREVTGASRLFEDESPS